MPAFNLLDYIDIVEGFKPVDLQTAANSGDYISLKNYAGALVVFLSAIGTNGDDPTLALAQATSVAGGSSKALTFTELFSKQAATDLSATQVWTKVTQAAASTYTNTDAAEQDLIWVVDVRAESLDVANGFDCIRATVADIGSNAQLGCLFYIPYGGRFFKAPDAKLASIID